MSRIWTQYIGKQVAADLDGFLVSGAALPYAEYKYPGDLPDEYIVYDIISDPDKTFCSGKRTSTNYRIQFTYYVKDDETKINTVPDLLEAYLIGMQYRPQGNRRSGFDAETERRYWQKDFFLKLRRI